MGAEALAGSPCRSPADHHPAAVASAELCRGNPALEGQVWGGQSFGRSLAGGRILNGLKLKISAQMTALGGATKSSIILCNEPLAINGSFVTLLTFPSQKPQSAEQEVSEQLLLRSSVCCGVLRQLSASTQHHGGRRDRAQRRAAGAPQLRGWLFPHWGLRQSSKLGQEGSVRVRPALCTPARLTAATQPRGTQPWGKLFLTRGTQLPAGP